MTYDQRIAVGTDDCRVYIPSNFLDTNGNYLFIGNADNSGFFRFQNLPMAGGATINSAYLTLKSHEFGSGNPWAVRIYGIKETNTGNFTTNPNARPRTIAYVDWNINPWQYNAFITTPDLKAIIQEIVDQGGWAATNALAFAIVGNGAPFGSDIQSYEFNSSQAARLQIDYTGITTHTRTMEALANISNPNRDVGIKIMKPTYGALVDNNPAHQIFNSDFGTLKYAISGSVQVNLVGGDLAAQGVVTHNLGYKPFVEVYVEFLASPGTYYPCPGYDAGATVFWNTSYRITNTELRFYVGTTGFFSDQQFRFVYFIFKNDLQL